eukprot:g73355.t1
MQPNKLIVGTYNKKLGHTSGRGKGVFVCDWNSDTGVISGPKLLDETVANPAYVVPDRAKEPSCFYACSEASGLRSPAEVAAGKTDVLFTLSLASSPRSFPSLGLDPCYLHASDGKLYCANYSDGGISVYEQDSKQESTPVLLAHHKVAGPGSNANKSRQADPHCHCIVPHPADALQFYVADLGKDLVHHFQLQPSPKGGKTPFTCSPKGGKTPFTCVSKSTLALPAASGPRTLCFHPTNPNILFVSLELSHGVAVLQLAHKDKLHMLDKVLQVCSSLEKPLSSPDGVAHTLTDNAGKYLYVANRSNNTLACFQIDATGDKEKPVQLSHPTWLKLPENGATPRHFTITPDDQYLLVASQEGKTPGIGVFKRQVEEGKLSHTLVSNLPLDCPVSLYFFSTRPTLSLDPTAERSKSKVHHDWAGKEAKGRLATSTGPEEGEDWAEFDPQE